MKHAMFVGIFVSLSLLTAANPAAAGIIYEVNGGASNGSVGSYTTSGTPVVPTLVSGLPNPIGVAVDSAGNFYVSYANSTIGSYTSTGSPINPTLITGLSSPAGIAIDGSNNLYVTNQQSGTIGKYTTSGGSGATIISGLSTPDAVAINPINGNLYVAQLNSVSSQVGSVSEYTPSGTPVSLNMISGIHNASGLAFDSSGNLYVLSGASNGSVGKYMSDGTPISTSLITGLDSPFGIAIDGTNLFVSSFTDGTITQYTTSGGSPVSLVNGLTDPYGIAIAAVPEPSSIFLVGIVGVAVACGVWLRRRPVVA